IPTGPYALSSLAVTAANTPGNTATIIVTHSSRKYASAAGKPAYVIGAYVSHQHVAKKKTTPKIHPSTNEAPVRSSRPIAHNSGTSATYAIGHRSKSGNASAISNAAATASNAFFHPGNLPIAFPNLISRSLPNRRRLLDCVTLTIRPANLTDRGDLVHKFCHRLNDKFRQHVTVFHPLCQFERFPSNTHIPARPILTDIGQIRLNP